MAALHISRSDESRAQTKSAGWVPHSETERTSTGHGGCGMAMGEQDSSTRVMVELRVDRRRALGRQLCFLVGCSSASTSATQASFMSIERFVGDDAETGHRCSSCLPSPLPMEVQLVLDAGVLGDGDDARLALNQAMRGDRVRAVGTLKLQHDAHCGALRWEVLCDAAYLLRPMVRAAPPNAAPATGIALTGGGLGGSSVAVNDDFMSFDGGGSVSEQTTPARKPKFRALPPREAALQAMSHLDEQQQRDAAASAAAIGDILRIEALVTLGFDFNSPLDEYGQSALFLAATHGHVPLLRKLVALCSPSMLDVASHGGTTPATAAAAKGHIEALAILSEAGADVGTAGASGLTPLEYVLRRAIGWRRMPPVGAQLVRLIDPNADHAGAGACYIDGAVSSAVLCALDKLFAALPMAARVKCSQGLNDRSYYCDSEGWVVEALRSAVLAVSTVDECDGQESSSDRCYERAACGGAPCEGEAMSQMRFLQYAEAGGGLPPHVDLSRTNREGRTSKCTFSHCLAQALRRHAPHTRIPTSLASSIHGAKQRPNSVTVTMHRR